MAEVLITQQEKARYAENLFPYESTLNMPFLPNTSGGASGEAEYVGDGTIPIYNRKATIRVIFTGITAVVFDLGNRLSFTAPYTGGYCIAFRVFVPTTYSSATITGKMVGFVNSANFDYDFSTTSTDFVFGSWNTFAQIIQLEAGDEYETEFKIASNTIGARIYLGGFDAKFNDRALAPVSFYTEPYNVISNSATLNFGSIDAGEHEDLTIALVGAKSGDAVDLGHPPLTSDFYFFIPFVSADDVVTVRCINYGGIAVDPVSGTFNVKIAR